MYKNLPTILVSASALVVTGIVISVSSSIGSQFMPDGIAAESSSATPTPTPEPSAADVPVDESGPSDGTVAPAPGPDPRGILSMTITSLGANIAYSPATGEDCSVMFLENYALTPSGEATGHSIGSLATDAGGCSLSFNHSIDGRSMACLGYTTMVVDLVVNGTVTQSQRYDTTFDATGCEDFGY